MDILDFTKYVYAPVRYHALPNRSQMTDHSIVHRGYRSLG